MNDKRRERINEWLSAVEKKVIKLYGETYAKALNLPEIKAAVNAGDDEFDWSKYPGAESKIEKMLSTLTKQLDMIISDGVKDSFDGGMDGATSEVRSLLGASKHNASEVAMICRQATNQRREEGLTGWNYIQEKRGGFTLSERVWQSTRMCKQELAIMVQNGVIEGKTAQQIAGDVKGCLREPNRLFRRVRDKETGLLRLSEAAKAYHPGQGVYRSSYKNALRVARTEVNQAYRVGECVAYEGNPLVKGYKIALSNNHTTKKPNGTVEPLKDICDKLAGEYPKWFKFSGWHPQCRCHMVPIPLSPKEVSEYLKHKKAGTLDKWKDPAIKEMPKNFRNWVAANKNNIEMAVNRGKLPYFLQDNPYSWQERPRLTPKEIAKIRHQNRTEEQEQAIRNKWEERENAIAKEKHDILVEASEQKFVKNMSDVVRQYMNDEERAEFDKAVGDIADTTGKVEYIMSRRNAIKAEIKEVASVADSTKDFLNDADVSTYVGKASAAIREKSLSAMRDLVDEIRKIPEEIESWKSTIEDPAGRVKRYGLDYTREAFEVISGVDSRVSSMGLEDALGVLKLYGRTDTGIFKEEFEKRIAYTEVSIKIRDLKPSVDGVVDEAKKSAFGSFKDIAIRILDAERSRDVFTIEKLIEEGKVFKETESRFEDLKKYETKSAKFKSAMDEASEAIKSGDMKLSAEKLDKAQKEKDILESSKAYHAARRAAIKAEKEAGKKVEKVIEPTVEEIDENAYIPKTLDELRKELGPKMPKTLAVLDKSMEAFEKTSSYGDAAKKYKDEIEATMKVLFEKHDYGMNIGSSVLELVIGSWFKNTFETGSSGGYKGSSKTKGKIETNHGRLKLSHKLFMNGRELDDQLERTEYEKYGNLLGHDIEKSLKGYNSAQGYGEVEVRFKKNKVIATWTAGDSLGAQYMPSLTTDPKASSYDSMSSYVVPRKGTQTENMEKFREDNIHSYLELQYHGKLTIDCIDSVAFRTDVNKSRQDKRTADLCVSKGIRVYHLVNGKLEVYGDPVMLAKIRKEKIDKRHAERLKRLHKEGKTYEEAVRDAVEERTKMHIKAREEAMEAGGEVSSMVSKDLSDSEYSKAMSKGDYMRARGCVKEMRKEHEKLLAREKAISDLIPDVGEQHKKYTIKELEAAHTAIKKKFEYIDKKYTGNLKKQSDQLEFEIRYLENPDNRKFDTWHIARDAYKRKLAEVTLKIKAEDTRKRINDVRAYKSRLKGVKEAIEEAERLFDAGDYDGASLKIAEASAIRMEHEMKVGKKAKSGEALQRLFESEAFSQARKDAALWAKNESNPQKAFDEIDKVMSKYAEDLWGRLTDEEKHVAWLYTSGSRYINEPFFTRYAGVKMSMYDGSVRNGEKDINTLTTIIEKAKPLENDMWVQHAEDMRAFYSRFGITPSDMLRPSSIIGREGVNEPFMSTSCAKHSFFTKKELRDMPIVMSIYLPKGTKGMYCEPFAYYGDGRTYSEDVSLRYGSDGMKWDGTSRQAAGIAAGDQVEFLLQRGAKLRITDVKVADGRYYVECELVEQMARPKFTSR